MTTASKFGKSRQEILQEIANIIAKRRWELIREDDKKGTHGS